MLRAKYACLRSPTDPAVLASRTAPISGARPRSRAPTSLIDYAATRVIRQGVFEDQEDRAVKYLVTDDAHLQAALKKMKANNEEFYELRFVEEEEPSTEEELARWSLFNA